MNKFENVRSWSTIRGIGADESKSLDKRLQSQMQRVFQEVNEIHEALVVEDWEEFEDACGDAIVTIINIAKIKGMKAEECLAKAFGVIEFRKGLTRDAGDFVRYGKLNDEDKKICDIQQGNPGNQYFLPENIVNLTPQSFKKTN